MQLDSPFKKTLAIQLQGVRGADRLQVLKHPVSDWTCEGPRTGPLLPNEDILWWVIFASRAFLIELADISPDLNHGVRFFFIQSCFLLFSFTAVRCTSWFESPHNPTLLPPFFFHKECLSSKPLAFLILWQHLLLKGPKWHSYLLRSYYVKRYFIVHLGNLFNLSQLFPYL